MEDEKAPEVGLKVNTGTVRGSVYAQVVGVVITDFDMTLEFVYVNPRNKSQGEAVARVTLPKSAAKGISDAILDTLNQHDKKKEDKK